jgi:alpha-galactosidase
MKIRRLVVLAVIVVVTGPGSAFAKDRTLALTPPMGWNSWNKFGCNVSETLIRQIADAMVSSGMKDAGYQYVVIDDCWQVSRDKDGNIVVDPKRFSSGMKALADYVHGKGLKFGLYSDAGAKTCGGRPGSRGHEFQDARQYAAWGVDYLKYDACFAAVCPAENSGRGPEDQKLEWCNLVEQHIAASQVAYKTMGEALDLAGRPIVFSMCEWGNAKPWHWAKEIGHLWRTTGDITDKWDGKKDWSHGMLPILDMQDGLSSFAGPGHWNDPDMLEVGNGGMTNTEYRSHMSLWALMAAPLVAGNDLRSMTPETKEILTNREVIAIDQDPLGRQGRRVRRDGELEVYARELADGGRAVILFNRGTTEKQITARWEDIGYPKTTSATVRDLWQHKNLGKLTGEFSAMVASHGVVMVTIKP